MNPIDFRFIHAVILIFLKFLRPVQNHVSGSHQRFVFLIVKMKMCGSGGNIQNLVVNPAAGSVCGQPGMVFQTICAAASDCQRLAFVFKVDQGIVQISGIDIHGNLPFRVLRETIFRNAFFYCIILCMFCPIQYIA